MHPDLFTLPGTATTITSYGFLVGLALLLGWLLSLAWAKADKLPADMLGTAYVLSAAFGVLGARGLWLVQHPDAWEGPASLVQLANGDLSAGGGLVLGVAVSLLFCLRRGIPFFAWADCAAPTFLLGVALDRVGAFLAGTKGGIYVDPAFPLGVRFPAGSPVYAFQVRTMGPLHLDPELSLPVHPVQLYTAGVAVLGFGLALWLRSRRRASGVVAAFVLGWYGLVRMVVEDAFRTDPSPILAGRVTLGQASAAVLAVVAFALAASRLRLAASSPKRARQWEGGPWSDNLDP